MNLCPEKAKNRKIWEYTINFSGCTWKKTKFNQKTKRKKSIFPTFFSLWTSLKSPTGNFCNIAYRYKLFMAQCLRYDYSLFLSKSFMYLLLACAYQWISWHIPHLMPFLTINNISVSLNKSNWLLSFLGLLAKLIQVRVKPIYFNTYSKIYRNIS